MLAASEDFVTCPYQKLGLAHHSSLQVLCNNVSRRLCMLFISSAYLIRARHRDTATVIPLLVTERIRRGTQLYEALTADLKSHAIRPEATEIEDLLHAVEHLYQELKQLN